MRHHRNYVTVVFQCDDPKHLDTLDIINQAQLPGCRVTALSNGHRLHVEQALYELIEGYWPADCSTEPVIEAALKIVDEDTTF